MQASVEEGMCEAGQGGGVGTEWDVSGGAVQRFRRLVKSVDDQS